MSVRKVIGKMGSLAKTTAQKAGTAIKESAKTKITKENIKQAASNVKHEAGEVVHSAGQLRDKAVVYAERVDNNTRNSMLLNSSGVHGRHEVAESFLFGSQYERREHRKAKTSKQVIVIKVPAKTKKRRSKRKKRSSAFVPPSFRY